MQEQGANFFIKKKIHSKKKKKNGDLVMEGAD